MFEFDEQCALNAKHRDNPEPGDYWHEMYCPVAVVLDVGRLHVVYCGTTKDTDKDHWTWNLEKIEVKTRKEFANYLRYSSDSMKEKTWADVLPRGHFWAVEAVAA